MGIASLSPDAASVLRQSLEHVAMPTLVVSRSAISKNATQESAKTGSDDRVIAIANAAARACGLQEGAAATAQLLALLQPPEEDGNAIAAAIRDGGATLRRWRPRNSQTTTLRVTPIAGDHARDDHARDLATVSWDQPQPIAPADQHPSEEHTRAQRDLHDWLARTAITRTNLEEIVRSVTARIADIYSCERVSLWLFSDDGQKLRCSDLYERSRQAHSSGQELSEADCRLAFETLRESVYVDVHDTQLDPRCAAYREAYLAPNSITSMLDAVVRFGGRCHGTLCLEHVKTPRVWQQDEIYFACTIANYLASALESLARAEAVELLSEREQFLRTLFNGSPVGIQVFEPDGTSRRMNHGMQKLLGLPSRDYDIGQYNLLKDPQAKAAGMDDIFFKAVAGQVTRIDRHEVDYSTEAYLDTPRRHEKFWLESVFFPVFRDDQTVEAVVVFAWEITDRVKAEQDRERLEQQLRQSQKLEAVGQLAGGVAHDFNNILTAARGFADILSMELGEEDSRNELVDQIRTASDRGTALTKQLLTFAGRQITKTEVFDASNAIVEMIPMLRRLMETNIQLEVTTNSATPIHADRSQLQQVVLNLIVNARDAMPDGGSVHVDITTADSDGQQPMMAMTVSDTGIGMSEEVRTRVFEPFFTTKQPGKGTGLGLSTIYGIVSESGGDITVDSRPNEGTKFLITWPLAETTNEAQDLPCPPQGRDGHGTVLVVEDDEANRLLAASVLQKSGYEVLVAEDAQTARKLVQTAAHVDLLLTDLVMPGIGGRLLAEELTQTQPGLRVVFMSGYTDDPVIRREVENDSADFLAKPYSAEQLANIVRSALAQ